MARILVRFNIVNIGGTHEKEYLDRRDVRNIWEVVAKTGWWVGNKLFLLEVLLSIFSPGPKLRPKDWTLKRKPGKKPQQQGRRQGAQSWAKVRSSCQGRGSQWSPGATQLTPGPKLCFSSRQWSLRCHRVQHSCHQLMPSSLLGSKKPGIFHPRHSWSLASELHQCPHTRQESLHHRRQAWIQRWKESQRGPENPKECTTKRWPVKRKYISNV